MNNMPEHFKVEMLHDNRVQLAKELKYHPKLCRLLDQYSMDDLSGRLAEIAAYVNIALCGDYLPEDIDELCGVLAKKLYESRSPIILN